MFAKITLNFWRRKSLKVRQVNFFSCDLYYVGRIKYTSVNNISEVIDNVRE